MTDINVQEAVQFIQKGGVVACPTEAVYGLSCDPQNEAAVQKLLAIKNRNVGKGLILVAANTDQLLPYVKLDSSLLWEEIKQSWPGPTTWLLPAATGMPFWINGGKDTVACRVTAHPEMKLLCETSGKALISTSANQAGKPASRTLIDVNQQCHGIDGILCGKLGTQENPSSIRDARTGAIIR